MSLVQLLRADLERQFFLEGRRDKRADVFQLVVRCLHPRFLPIILCRFSRALFLSHVPILPQLCSYLNLVLFGLQVTPKCEIGPGLFFPHPTGIVIGAWRLGRNVTVFQGVTLGAKHVDFGFTAALLPAIGNEVTVGAGAKVLGGIVLGDRVTVGANAVVLNSVNPGCTVVGIPAHSV